MKKIFSGLLGLFLVIGIVAGTGYALFSSKVGITGMVLGTSTPLLQASINNSAWSSTLPMGNNPMFQLLVPGKYDWGEFYLQNASNGGLKFNLTGKITAAQGDWGLLSNVVQMRVCVYDTDPNILHCGAQNTGWKTLTQWNAGEVVLPGGALNASEVRHLAINLYLDSDAGNGYIGKQISDISFDITGTQIP